MADFFYAATRFFSVAFFTTVLLRKAVNAAWAIMPWIVSNGFTNWVNQTSQNPTSDIFLLAIFAAYARPAAQEEDF